MKKSDLLFSLLFILVFACVSCEEDKVTDEKLPEKLNLSDMELGVDFDSYDINDMDLFINELSAYIVDDKSEPKMTIDIEVLENNNPKAYFSVYKKDANGRIDPPEHFDPAEECRTCRSEQCVKDAVAEAIGDGKKDVTISYDRNLLSAEVCWWYD